jgi:GT2 family glycosyltransferase
MLPASLYQSVGGFDEGFFMYAEDLDLCLRTRSLGAELVVVNHAIVHEVGSGVNGRYSNLYLYENTKNRLVCLRRYRLGCAGVSLVHFVSKYGALRTLQLAMFSPEPMNQIGAAWRGLWDGYFHMPQCQVAKLEKPTSGAI